MSFEIRCGDSLAELRKMPSNSVDCCVTSPPYWSLRDYSVAGQIGLEATPEAWCAKLVEVFREVRRVLKSSGSLWLNIGDSYAGSGKTGGKNPALAGTFSFAGQLGSNDRTVPAGIKRKDMIGQPWMLAFALRADGWYLRSDIVWQKTNCTPSSVRDRPTTSHEYIFLLSKNEHYFYDHVAAMEPVTGTSRPRGHGVNSKASASWQRGPGAHDTIQHSKAGANSRMYRDRDPAHQTTAKIRAKQKQSFNAAVTGRVEMRNLRSVWSIATSPYRGGHFATFSPAIPDRIIRIATSEYGCCVICGEPWVRQIEKVTVERKALTDRDQIHHESDIKRGRLKSNAIAAPPVTIGWVPSCACTVTNGQVRPAVVMDCFSGAGTTVMAAERLGRDSIGIELSQEYCRMAEARIVADRSVRSKAQQVAE